MISAIEAFVTDMKAVDILNMHACMPAIADRHRLIVSMLMANIEYDAVNMLQPVVLAAYARACIILNPPQMDISTTIKSEQ